MNINLYSCGSSIKYSAFKKADLHVCVNSSALFVKRCDFLAFMDKLVYDELIVTKKIEPKLGYITNIAPFDNKFYINPMFSNLKAVTDSMDLGWLVSNGCELTAPLTLGVISLMKPSLVRLYGFDLSDTKDTETNGLWISRHDRFSNIKEAIWLRWFVKVLERQGCNVEYCGRSEFMFYVMGEDSNEQFLSKLLKCHH